MSDTTSVLIVEKLIKLMTANHIDEVIMGNITIRKSIHLSNTAPAEEISNELANEVDEDLLYYSAN